MLSLRSNYLSTRICYRYYSFLNRFCKKTSNDLSARSLNVPDVTIPLESTFKLYNLEIEPASTVSINKEAAVKFYQEMLTIRRFENACANLYKEKVIRGFCHLYVGQEACCVGIKSSMRPQDTAITSYRAHGWTYVMGVSVYEIIAELCQKETGCSRGKGGSMHTYGQNFFGGNGIVGSQTPIGAGVAFSHAYRCDGGVCFTCYGDGAANQGQLHETFNTACLWKLPVVFVCENNQYGMGTSSKRSSCSTDYYTRGDYIPGLWVNGNDVLAVKNAAEFALEYACSCGPIVVELQTYRYLGHSMSDPGTSYRTRDEVQMMREKHDPIAKFREVCLKYKIIKEEEFKHMNDAVKTTVDNAITQARQDKEPDPKKDLAADIYVKNLQGNIRNILRYDLKHRNVGTRLVPEGVAKATLESDIKQITKEKIELKPPTLKDNAKDLKAKNDFKQGNQPAVKDTKISVEQLRKSDAKKDKLKNDKDPKME